MTIRMFLRRLLNAEPHSWYGYAVIVRDDYIAPIEEKDIPLFGARVIRRHLAQGQAYGLARELNAVVKDMPVLPRLMQRGPLTGLSTALDAILAKAEGLPARF